MKIGIVTAMPEEFRAVAKSLGTAAAEVSGADDGLLFRSAGHEFRLIESGMCFTNAFRATGTLVRDEQPDLLISTGYCGAITPELRVGDIVVAQRILIADDNGMSEVPVHFSGCGQSFVAHQSVTKHRVFGGTFVSTAAIMAKKPLASRLSGDCRTPVVEMESGAVAMAAAENGIPLLAIRSVSDTSDEEPGFALSEFCGPDLRRIYLPKVLLTVVKRPGILSQLIRLHRSSKSAAESLSGALSRLFARF